jgi:hypothetical protein
LSDAYARQILQVFHGGTIVQNRELLRLSHDLRVMDSDFRPLSTPCETDLL